MNATQSYTPIRRTRMYARISRKVRYILGLKGHPCPIEFVDGFASPRLRGQPCHHRNKSGDVIHHPLAYMRAKGWPVYHPSTLRITVGIGWCMEQGLCF